jgi:hypothetical protein
MRALISSLVVIGALALLLPCGGSAESPWALPAPGDCGAARDAGDVEDAAGSSLPFEIGDVLGFENPPRTSDLSYPARTLV